MEAREIRLRKGLGRLLGAWLTLAKSKRALFGISVILFYSLLAVLAPVITPYDPVNGYFVAQKYDAPSWYRTLGLQKGLSDNVALSDPQTSGFNTPQTMSAWTLKTNQQNLVSFQYSSTVGHLALGSLQMSILPRPAGSSYGVLNFTLSKTFRYPYDGPPGRFFANIYTLLNITGEPVLSGVVPQRGVSTGTDSQIEFVDSNHNGFFDLGEAVVYDTNNNHQFDSGEFVITGSASNPGTLLSTDNKIRYVESGSSEADPLGNHWEPGEAVVYDTNNNGKFDTPLVAATAFIERLGNQTYQVWSTSFNNFAASASWVAPDPAIDSVDKIPSGFVNSWFKSFGTDVNSIYPEQIVFNKAQDYAFIVNFKVLDLQSNIPVSGSIFLDDLNLKLLGTAFGLLGTDQQGRDLFSQLVYGARISLIVGLLAAAVGVAVGLVVGLVAGFKAGVTDEVLMRFTDMLLVLPGLPLILVLVAVLRPSIWTIIGVIGLLGWMGFARVIRSQVVSLKERPFVEASKAVGAGTGHIISRHILPNVMGLTYVSLATAVPGAITLEAALSFLGLSDPIVISWGKMLNNANQFQGFFYWWWVIPPGLSIALLSLSFILIGYALDDVLNPRLRQRR